MTSEIDALRIQAAIDTKALNEARATIKALTSRTGRPPSLDGVASSPTPTNERGMTMSVRAKFWVTETTNTTSGGSVKLSAVCRGQDNKQWAQATPTGQITMNILNGAALEQFTPGAEFYVDFTPAPKGQEGMGEFDHLNLKQEGYPSK